MLSQVLDKHLRAMQNPTPTQATFSAPKTGSDAPTEKQVSFYKALVEKKQLTDDQRTHLKTALSAFDRRSITVTIGWLIALPWTPRPIITTPRPSPVAQGCYAIHDGELKFYSVQTPTEGKWKGFTFLSQLSGENHIRIRDTQERQRILSLIAQDAVGALKLFGQKIGRCGHCRKQLTDAVSREFGIGPVCRKALGI